MTIKTSILTLIKHSWPFLGAPVWPDPALRAYNIIAPAARNEVASPARIEYFREKQENAMIFNSF